MRSRNVAKNIMSSLFLQLITIICGFIVPRMIIGSFGSATNGLINSITQFLAYITLLESGFGPVVRSILYKPIASKDKETIRRILKATEKFFRIIATIFIVYIVALCLLYPVLVDNQFDTWYTVSLLVIIAAGTFAEYFFGMTYKLFLQAEQKTYVTSYFQIVATILTTIVVVVLIKMGCSIQVVKIATAVVAIIRPLLQGLYVKRKYQLDLGGIDSKYVIKQKWDGLAQHIAAVIHGNTDITVLTVLSTMEEVSVYAVYMIVIKGVKSIAQAFNDGIDASFGNMLAKKEFDTLNRRFSAYELFFHTISSVMFICTMALITPFVSVYTQGITDADYVRPVFGILIAVSEFVWAIRLPYSSVTLAAGHFKQTMKGAWVEATVNIVLSVILVFNFGIVGVAIGTIVAMAIRTVEFMYHNSKYILKRNVFRSFSWLAVIAVESVIVLLISNIIVPTVVGSYLEWVKYAIIVLGTTLVVVLPINAVCYRRDLKELKGLAKQVIKRGGK